MTQWPNDRLETRERDKRYEDQTGTIALVHSGRAGTMEEIAAKTVEKMRAHFGTKPEDLRAILGPCLYKNIVDMEIGSMNEKNAALKNSGSGLKRSRYLYLDILKTIALILMPLPHIYEVADGLEMLEAGFPFERIDTVLGVLYLFITALFLFSMGCSLVLTGKNTPADYARRGLKLLLVGFVLNVVRAGLPYVIMGLLIDPSCYIEALNWMVLSDIIYFDGLFFLLFALLKKINMSDWMILATAVVMMMASHFIPSPVFSTEAPGNFVGNFIYVNSFSSFPILSWFIYPVLGYLYQKKYDTVPNKDTFVLKAGIAGAAGLILTTAVLLVTNTMEKRYFLWGEMDFRMDIPTTLITGSVMFAYMSIIYFVARGLKAKPLQNFCTTTSVNINRIYCIHWVLVNYGILFWSMLAKRGTERGGMIFVIGIVIFAASWFLAKLKVMRKILP